jgi:cytochrome c556
MTKRHQAWPARTVTLVVATIAGCASQPERDQPPQQAQLVQAISPPARLEPPEYLSGMARAVLRTRMASHARDMGDLMSAIMVLQYDRIRDRASAIASDASLARPLTGDATELNSALPEKFFQHQDELKAGAKALAVAADKQSAFAVAEAYGRVSETCVRCHGVYRQGR